MGRGRRRVRRAVEGVREMRVRDDDEDGGAENVGAENVGGENDAAAKRRRKRKKKKAALTTTSKTYPGGKQTAPPSVPVRELFPACAIRRGSWRTTTIICGERRTRRRGVGATGREFIQRGEAVRGGAQRGETVHFGMVNSGWYPLSRRWRIAYGD